VLVSVTVAPAITELFGSVIVPLTVPRLVWANAVSARLKNKSVKNAALTFMFPSPIYGNLSYPGLERYPN
jgi:hypothetical protein